MNFPLTPFVLFLPLETSRCPSPCTSKHLPTLISRLQPRSGCVSPTLALHPPHWPPPQFHFLGSSLFTLFRVKANLLHSLESRAATAEGRRKGAAGGVSNLRAFYETRLLSGSPLPASALACPLTPLVRRQMFPRRGSEHARMFNQAGRTPPPPPPGPPTNLWLGEPPARESRSECQLAVPRRRRSPQTHARRHAGARGESPGSASFHGAACDTEAEGICRGLRLLG